MTSRRRRKRAAQQKGLTESELRLLELLEEILEAMRWAQVLGYANQFLLQEKLEVADQDRDRVLSAAAAAVERDGRIQEWRRRIQEVRQALEQMDADLRGGQEKAARPRPAPPDGMETAGEAADGG